MRMRRAQRLLARENFGRKETFKTTKGRKGYDE